MRRIPDFDQQPVSGVTVDAGTRLGDEPMGYRGVITGLDAASATGRDGLPAAELERRLLEMGFVEGAHVELLHEGLFGGDPIAVKLDDMRVALRRREARGVMVLAHTAR